MKANELRIGNLVKATLTSEIYKIDVWALRKIDYGNYQNSYDTETTVYEPISLTEEWLLKLEFIEHMDKDVFIHPSLRYLDKFKLRDDGVLVYVSSEVYISNCKYVHQLQNLYFALTGEELTIGGDNE